MPDASETGTVVACALGTRIEQSASVRTPLVRARVMFTPSHAALFFREIPVLYGAAGHSTRLAALLPLVVRWSPVSLRRILAGRTMPRSCRPSWYAWHGCATTSRIMRAAISNHMHG